MPLPSPITRDTMRGLKAKTDEERRIQKVEIIVSQIYEKAIVQAMTTADTKYKYRVPMPIVPRVGYLPREVPHQNEWATVHKDNMTEIVSKLRDLFPMCAVEYKSVTMAMGNNGKMQDVSDLDEKSLSFIKNSQTNSYIIVDWS